MFPSAMASHAPGCNDCACSSNRKSISTSFTLFNASRRRAFKYGVRCSLSDASKRVIRFLSAAAFDRISLARVSVSCMANYTSAFAGAGVPGCPTHSWSWNEWELITSTHELSIASSVRHIRKSRMCGAPGPSQNQARTRPPDLTFVWTLYPFWGRVFPNFVLPNFVQRRPLPAHLNLDNDSLRFYSQFVVRLEMQ